LAVYIFYDQKKIPQVINQENIFILRGAQYPEKIDTIPFNTLLFSGKRLPAIIQNKLEDKNINIIMGKSRLFSQFTLSYLKKIGATFSDIPYTDNFRLPIGDDANPYYSCGASYKVPPESDFGEYLSLLSPNLDTLEKGFRPIFNKENIDNSWQVKNGFIEEIYQSHPKSSQIFNNGVDWYFTGREKGYPRLPIHAVADGIIVNSSKDYNNSLVLAHKTPAGIVLSVYSHLDEKSLCSVGSIVRKGNVIGTIGSIKSGFPYLHFEIAKLSFLKEDDMSGEILAPDFWYGKSDSSEILKNYLDPTNFIINITGNYQWDFSSAVDKEGWSLLQSDNSINTTALTNNNDFLSIAPGLEFFQIMSSPLNLEASVFNTVVIRLRSKSLSPKGKIYFTTLTSPRYSDNKSVSFDILDNNIFQEYPVEMTKNNNWRGIITGIRFSFEENEKDDTSALDIDFIRLGKAHISPVKSTGQTRCYDNLKQISCPSKGENFYGQDALFSATKPDYSETTINNELIIHDNITNLSWQKNNNGQKYSWEEALEFTEKLEFAGNTDWRLPTSREFQSIVNLGCQEPGLGDDSSITCFPYTQPNDSCFWTDTSKSYRDPLAQKFCFKNNLTMDTEKNEKNLILVIRGKTFNTGFYRDNKNGTVTDITTNLIWQQSESKSMTWENALKFCQNLKTGGYNDWRLPTIKELSTLSDDTFPRYRINNEYFRGARPTGYWSSTTDPLFPDFAWFVRFDDGLEHSGHKGRRYFVRAVRSRNQSETSRSDLESISGEPATHTQTVEINENDIAHTPDEEKEKDEDEDEEQNEENTDLNTEPDDEDEEQDEENTDLNTEPDDGDILSPNPLPITP
jgi:murein DD-endopeptidase MepM/ murein hydrolase activator NlpD